MPREQPDAGPTNRANRAVDLLARLLLPLLHRPGRIVCGLVLVALLTPLTHAYFQLRDNNSALGMLDRAEEEDYRYFVDEYLPSFGSRGDDVFYIVFETLDALSSEARNEAARIQRTLRAIKVSFRMGAAVPDASDPRRLRLRGEAEWPWRGEAPSSPGTCLLKAQQYDVTYGQCLRRFMFPVEISAVSDDSGNTWAIDARPGSGGFRTAASRPIAITCDEERRRCELQLVQSTLSYLDMLSFLPGDNEDAQLDSMKWLLGTSTIPDQAVPPIKDFLIGGERASSDAKYSAVTVMAWATNLQDRDDIRSVGIEWVNHEVGGPRDDGVNLRILGTATVLAMTANEIAKTHVTIEPLAIVLAFIFIGLTTRRSARMLLIPLCTALASLVTAMGLYSLAGGSYNWISVILPVILVVTSVSDSIHLLGHYREKCLSCVTRDVAFSRTIHALASPCFFTSLTTGIGLFCIYCVSGPGEFANFGLYGALGVMMAYLYSLIFFGLFAPPLEQVRGPRFPEAQAAVGHRGAYVAWLIRWCKPIVLVTILLVVASLSTVTRIRSGFDHRKWYDDDTALFQDVRFVDTTMSGSNFVSIVVSPVAGAAASCTSLDASQLDDPVDVCLTDGQVAALWAIHDRVLLQGGAWAELTVPDYEGREINWIAKSSGVLELVFASPELKAEQVVGRLECLLHGGIPPFRAGIADATCDRGAPSSERARIIADQMRMLFNTSSPDPVIRGRHTQVHLIGRQGNGAQLQEHLATLQNDLADDICAEGKGCQGRVTGYPHIITKYLQEVFVDMTRGFALALVTVFAVMFLLLRRYPYLALLSLLPNVVPFALVVGIMVALDIPVHHTTMMVAAVAMGLVVDDTIQFSYALSRELDDSREKVLESHVERTALLSQAITRTISSTGHAMIITSLSLMAGFSALLFGDLQPMKDTGALLLIVILLALLCDLILFPALLLWLAHNRRFLQRLLGG